MPNLELEPSSHTYKLDGVEIPGCTSVLTAVGAAPSFWFLSDDELQYYRDRGHAVHKMIELSIRGTLDKRTIQKDLKPYLIGWQRFCDDYNVEVIRIPVRPTMTFDSASLSPCGPPQAQPFTEIPLHHDIYRYGVTPDVVARVKGQLTVIELKATSQHSAATSIQTAAQLLAVEQALGTSLNGATRWACRLTPDEPHFDPKDYKERGDRSTWIGMLSTFNWLRKNNPRALRSNP